MMGSLDATQAMGMADGFDCRLCDVPAMFATPLQGFAEDVRRPVPSPTPCFCTALRCSRCAVAGVRGISRFSSAIRFFAPCLTLCSEEIKHETNHETSREQRMRSILHPIIRDQAGAPKPLSAAIAAISGQPLSAVTRALKAACRDLRGLAGISRAVAIEDAAHMVLARFGFSPSRLYADARRRPALIELLRVYARAPGASPQRLLVLCEGGAAYAVRGGQIAACGCAAPRELDTAISDGLVDPQARVNFALTFVVRARVPVAQPDHRFLEQAAIAAYALAEAYGIEVVPFDWPYWSISFPGELSDGAPGSETTLVCGEHELLSAISGRVCQHETAAEATRLTLQRLSLC